MATAASPSDSGLDINWQWWSAQQEALEALQSGEFDLTVFRGGYGSGKSVLGARATIMFAVDVPRSDNLILAQDSTKGGPSTFKKFFEELPGEDTVPDEGGDPENSPLHEHYNRNKSRLTVYNGAVIRLGSADKWNRFAGSEFNFIWADEVAHYDNTDLFKLDEMLTSRQRTIEGPNVTLWTSTGNGYNDFWQFVELQETPDGDDVTTRMHNVVADSRRNPFLPEKEKQVRKFAGGGREEEALAGGFSAAEGLVYDHFSRDRHVVAADSAAAQAARENDWRMYGYDSGYGDPRVVLDIGKTPTGVFVVLDHFHRTESQPEDVIDPNDGTGWLAGRPEGTNYREHVPEHVDKFRRAGWPVQNAIKDVDDGIEYVQGRLKDDGEHGPGLLVSEDCGQLIREFMSYQEDEIGTSGATDHCFVAGTPVLTDEGERPIETIEPGDRVLTRDGYKRVVGAGKTAEDADVLTAHLSDGRTLTGTGSHPIHTVSEGFKQLDSLRYDNILSTVAHNEYVCQQSRQSSTTASRSGGIQSPTTPPTASTSDHPATTSATALKRCIGRFGRMLMAWMRFLTATSSTTRTARLGITPLKTSNASLLPSTFADTPTWPTSPTKRSRRGLKRRRSGTSPTKDESGTSNTGKNLSAQSLRIRKPKTVNSAAMSPFTSQPPGSAQTPVKQRPDENVETMTNSGSASSAEVPSQSTSTRSNQPVRVVAVERSKRGRTVYNLTVEDQHEYYANGILVHNCLDSLRYALYTDEYGGKTVTRNEVAPSGGRSRSSRSKRNRKNRQRNRRR